MAVFFSSDFHFGHANIIRYCNRPFTAVAEMDDTIINNVNAVVRPDDTLYFLGDFCMGVKGERYIRQTAEYRQRIQCRNIVLIWGNHDRRGSPGFAELFTSTHDLLDVSVEGQRIVLCHYAMRVWNKSHHGSWHLYGHSHGTLPDLPEALSFDVGVDVWDYRPVSFAQVKEAMNKKSPEAFMLDRA